MHLDGARAQEQLARNLLIGPTGGHHPDDLHLAAGQTAVLELRGRSLAKPPFRPFAQCAERARELVGQRLRAEPSSRPVGGDEVPHSLRAGRRPQGRLRAALRLRAFERCIVRLEQYQRPANWSPACSALPSMSAVSPSACESADIASS